jgi:hypothetical protein
MTVVVSALRAVFNSAPACTQYWNEPSPIPPLAVAKNDPVLIVGSHSICWAMVEVDSLTMTESGGLILLSTA